jgi:thiamine-phosphate pyrophosphorylase
MPAEGVRQVEQIGRLHVLTDLDAAADPLDVVDAALAAGAPVIQVRAKDTTDRRLFALAEIVASRCRRAGATCLIDDRIDICLAVGADGVHLGDDDVPVRAARRVLGDEAIIGATARDPEAARWLVSEGVDYLGVGPTYVTATKSGLPDALGPERVGAVAAAVDVPVIAIAGITAERVPEVLAAGVHGVAVVGAVSRADDPKQATADLLAAIEAST